MLPESDHTMTLPDKTDVCAVLPEVNWVLCPVSILYTYISPEYIFARSLRFKYTILLSFMSVEPPVSYQSYLHRLCLPEWKVVKTTCRVKIRLRSKSICLEILVKKLSSTEFHRGPDGIFLYSFNPCQCNCQCNVKVPCRDITGSQQEISCTSIFHAVNEGILFSGMMLKRNRDAHVPVLAQHPAGSNSKFCCLWIAGGKNKK